VRKGEGIVIVTPALADANNGNWRTAQRWRRMLRDRAPVRIVREWPDPQAGPADRVMLALHARRSAASIAAWAEARGTISSAAGLAVVLTGTDLYRDIHHDAAARRSLRLARRLVVLQERGPDELAAALRARAVVIYQSARACRPLAKSRRSLRALMVGHLRDEKAPQTLFAAARLLRGRAGIRIDHIGADLDATLGRRARATMAACPGYRWLGARSHGETRRGIQRAHVLVHASRMEGGAHVLIEAVRSGTPVIASRIPGNVGMLGEDYEGYFEPGNAKDLARLLRRCAEELPVRGGGWLSRLRAQCAAREPLFRPQAEKAALGRLVAWLAQPD
jgi:putative glycosyltransferase (TIGR04348 family)